MGCTESKPQKKKGRGAPRAPAAPFIRRPSEPPEGLPLPQRDVFLAVPRNPPVDFPPRTSSLPRDTPVRPQRNPHLRGHRRAGAVDIPGTRDQGFQMETVGSSHRDRRQYQNAPFEGDELPEHIPGHRPTSARSVSAAGPGSSREDLGSSPLVFNDSSTVPVVMAPSARADSESSCSEASQATRVSGYEHGMFRTRITAEPGVLSRGQNAGDDAASVATDDSTQGMVEGQASRRELADTARRATEKRTEYRKNRNFVIDQKASNSFRGHPVPAHGSSSASAHQVGDPQGAGTSEAVASSSRSPPEQRGKGKRSKGKEKRSKDER